MKKSIVVLPKEITFQYHVMRMSGKTVVLVVLIVITSVYTS